MRELENKLRGALLKMMAFRDHLQGCEEATTDFCTCGMKQAADNARRALNAPPDKRVAELIHPLDLGMMYNNCPLNVMIDESFYNDDLIEFKGKLYYQTTRVPPSEEALRAIRTWGTAGKK